MASLGKVDREEMYRVFNMGIGLILVVPAASVDSVIACASALGDRGYRIGEIVTAREGEPQVEYVE